MFERLKPEWRCQECGLALDGSGGTVYTATKLFGVYQRSFSKFIIIPQDEVEMVVKEIRLMEERERGGVRKCVEVLEE